MTITYFVVSLISGVLFGVMDGVINSNPLASQLYPFYNPLARSAVNVPAGVVIDLAYGFIMAGIFLVLYEGLPGEMGVLKGISYGLIVWFFRVVMYLGTQFVVFNLPPASMLYSAATGLVEMLVLGVLYGLTLKVET